MKFLSIALFSVLLPTAIYAAGDEECEFEERLCVSSEIFLIDGEDAVPYPNSTIAITSSDNSTVTFSITQDFVTTGTLDFLYPVFDSDGRDMACISENAMVNVAPGYSQTFTADCDEWGKASVELFARDNSFSGVSSETNYRACPDWWGASKIATYKLELSCDTTPVCGPDYEAELVAEEEALEEEETGYKCQLPKSTRFYSLITRGDAEISAGVTYGAVAIGGTMSNPLGNQIVIGSESGRMSYVFRLVNKCLMDFKGYRQVGAYLRKVVDFEHFEYLVQNAESRRISSRNTIVMTRGGTFDIRDFCLQCEGSNAETGANLLILFNTNETVTLKGSADGLPFLASVIAPYSRVELDGSAGYIDGHVVADTFATVGVDAGSLEIRGKSMSANLYCGPTEAPTWAPTPYKPESYENICLTGQILLTNDEDIQPLKDGAIAIESVDEATVTFSITNLWKNKVSWVLPVFDQGGESMVCSDLNRMIKPALNSFNTYTADCTDGKARVDVFVRDGMFAKSTQENINNCPTKWWPDTHYKGLYSFELSCTVDDICHDYTTVNATGANIPNPSIASCKLPTGSSKYAIVTKSHAEISMHEISNAIAIGGLLSNPQNTSIIVASNSNRQSYIHRIVDECDVEFMGGRTIGTPLEDVIDFSHFEWLARNAYNRTDKSKSVIVMTHGGSFSTWDFKPGFKPQWKDNRKTVIIFNTNETVILNQTEDGQPFRPMVIAPFSRVELHSDAGSMEGAIIAHTFASTGSNPSALSMQGRVYTGNFTCDPDAAPLETVSAALEAKSERLKYKGSEVCVARGTGDPHMRTFDGIKYDAHAKGEVILVKSLNSTFEIQARFEATGKKGTAGPAVTTGIVVKEDATKNLPTVQVSAARGSDSTDAVVVNGCPLNLYVDGISKNITEGSGSTGATVDIVNRNAVEIEYEETNLLLKIGVKIGMGGKCVFNVRYILADCRREEHLVGLLGTPNGDYSDDWMTRNGTVLEIPDDTKGRYLSPAYNYTVTNWCIIEESESYFAYESGTDFDYFQNCTLPFDNSIIDIINNATEELIELCDGNIGCVIDGVMLGTDGADTFLEEQEETNSTDPSLNETILGTTSSELFVDDEESSEDDAPVSPAGSLGDPHFRTWTNEHFEYHGQCDLVLAMDQKFADGLGLDVQIRTKLVRYWSYIRRAAIRIGDDILEIEGDAIPEDSVTQYWFNFEYNGKVDSISGFPIVRRQAPYKRTFEIDLDSKYPGQKIVISTYKEFVRVDFHNGNEDSYGNVAGLLGDFKTGKTFARDGEKIIHDFSELGMEWQLRPTDNMLFHDISDPQFPKGCIQPEDPQGERRRRLDESSVPEDKAEAACAAVGDEIDRKNCVYDILATQDLDMVGAY